MILVLVLTGCAGKGFHYPGPLRGLGAEPPPYSDRIAPENSAPQTAPERKAKTRTRKKSSNGSAVAQSAGKLVGLSRLKVDGKGFRYDCSGMVSAAYTDAGVTLSGSSASLHARALKNGSFHERKRPEIGDVVFFDNTWDRNGNGKRDDALTHVAIVESMDEAGTQTLVHLGGSGIKRIYMNLDHPSEAKNEDGETINSYLRRGSTGERLTGQLWSGFGSLWDVEIDGLSMGVCTLEPTI
jgi:hypothetical protein